MKKRIYIRCFNIFLYFFLIVVILYRFKELDFISQQWGGLPDSLLKPCMLTVLNRHLSETSVGWMRQHLEALIKCVINFVLLVLLIFFRLWKSEVMKERLFERPTRVKLQAPLLEPVKDRKRKRAVCYLFSIITNIDFLFLKSGVFRPLALIDQS